MGLMENRQITKIFSIVKWGEIPTFFITDVTLALVMVLA